MLQLFSSLFVNQYNSRLLSRSGDSSIFQVELMRSWISLPAWIFQLLNSNFSFKSLWPGANCWAVCTSKGLTVLTLCTFNNWQNYFLHLIKMLWESASGSPLCSFIQLHSGWQPLLNVFILLCKSLIFLFLIFISDILILSFNVPPFSRNVSSLYVLYFSDYPHLIRLDIVIIEIWLVYF
jgi:hypothetical protein